MNTVGIILLGIGLSLDTFAVSLSLGFAGGSIPRGRKVRYLLLIGLFHTLMILLGWLMGENMSRIVAAYDHWISFLLLALLGGKMIYEGFTCEEEKPAQASLLSLRNTILLSLALSIDALISGFSLGLVDVSVVESSVYLNMAVASLIVGFCALVISAAGMFIGKKASPHMGCRAEIFGGIILIAIGVRVLLEHIL